MNAFWRNVHWLSLMLYRKRCLLCFAYGIYMDVNIKHAHPHWTHVPSKINCKFANPHNHRFGNISTVDAISTQHRKILRNNGMVFQHQAVIANDSIVPQYRPINSLGSICYNINQFLSITPVMTPQHWSILNKRSLGNDLVIQKHQSSLDKDVMIRCTVSVDF